MLPTLGWSSRQIIPETAVGPRAGGGSSGERQGPLWKDSACKRSHSEKDNDHRISLLCGIQETNQDHRGRVGKKETRRNQRETNHKRLVVIGNKLRAAGGVSGAGVTG